VSTVQVSVLGALPSSWHAALLQSLFHAGCCSDTRIGQRARNSDVLSQWLSCPGTRESPSGRFPSERLRPCGSFETEMPAQAMARPDEAMIIHRPKPHSGTAVEHTGPNQFTKPETDSKPYCFVVESQTHDDTGMVKSQSPLCGDEAARKKASPNCVLKLDFTRAWPAKLPVQSHNRCFGGRVSGEC